MKHELGLLNIICIVMGLLFIGFAAFNAIFLSAQLLTTDNLFVTMVCMVMALMFIVNPLLYLKSEGRLSIPFKKKSPRPEVAQLAGSSPPLLDAKGRAVPPDVKSMVANMSQKQPKDV
ncbi:MAG: hypothetical protein ACREBG_25010 [Pyrinomonadaceae bacterium]